MKKNEMKDLALLFKRLLIEKESAERIRADVIEMRKSYQKVSYC